MRALLTLDQLATFAGTELDAYPDDQRTAAINAVSRWFERAIGHEFYYSESATFSFRGSGVSRIEFYGFKAPLAGAPTAIADRDGNSIADAVDCDYLPEDGPPYEELGWIYGYFATDAVVKITAPWGWATIPDEVQYGAYLMVRKYLTDDGYAEAILSGSATGDDIKRVKIEQTEVEFFGATPSADSITSSIATVDGLIEKYRRSPGGKVI